MTATTDDRTLTTTRGLTFTRHLDIARDSCDACGRMMDRWAWHCPPFHVCSPPCAERILRCLLCGRPTIYRGLCDACLADEAKL
jgi:hypothetical protein